VGLKNSIKTLVQGGRYNDLTSKILGLKKIPAVGAAINL
jgi:histidyl-tRNA synthetase